MTEKHSEYNIALDEYTQGIVEDIFHEIHDELDKLEQTVGHSELSVVILALIRDRVEMVSENYKR
jgi:hypothetical protein